MNVIKKSINTGLRKYNRFRVHAYNSLEANAALEMIERQSGRLDIKYKKSADEYAMDVLGDRRYAPWIYAFSAIRRSFVEGWFPEYYYGFEVRPRTDGKYGNLAILKTLTNRILRVDSIPDSAYLISGNIYTNEFKPVAFKEARDIIFKDSEVVFFKENDSASGKGVERIERKNFRESDFQMRTDGCFQSMILQNDFFKAINASSTATLRITTVRDKAGMIGVRAAYLRVGRDNERFVRSDSGVRIPVDINTGVLGEVGFMNDWSYSARHPDSGFVYSGKQIPFSVMQNTFVPLYMKVSLILNSLDGMSALTRKIKLRSWNGMQTEPGFYSMKHLPAHALLVLAGKNIGNKPAKMIHLSRCERPVKE